MQVQVKSAFKFQDLSQRHPEFFSFEITRFLIETNTNPNDTEVNAAGRSGNARALRKQGKCGVIHEGEGHWPKLSQNLQKARHLWVARTPQKQ